MYIFLTEHKRKRKTNIYMQQITLSITTLRQQRAPRCSICRASQETSRNLCVDRSQLMCYDKNNKLKALNRASSTNIELVVALAPT